MKLFKALILMLFVTAPSLTAWEFQPKPVLYYPEYGSFALLSDSYGWSQLGKYFRAYDNDLLSMGLETGYQSTLLRLPTLTAVLDVRLNLMNDYNPRSDWYFNPRAVITDTNFSVFYPIGERFSQSVYIHHDCKHDVDLDSVRMVAHDWLGTSVHMEELSRTWRPRLSSRLQSEVGFNYFINQLYDYLVRDHQQARAFHTLSADLLMWDETYSVFLQTNTEVFISDKDNPLFKGNQMYTDFMGKAGLRFYSEDQSLFTLYAQWDYINDNLMVFDYSPGWYFSIGFSFSG